MCRKACGIEPTVAPPYPLASLYTSPSTVGTSAAGKRPWIAFPMAMSANVADASTTALGDHADG
jgi:hypothetical protein